MAPFKLKFRMGTSRSTSQETDTETSAQALIQNTATQSLGTSNTTLDSEFNSLNSLNNDQRNLISNNSTEERIGYSNPTLVHNLTSTNVPLSPPPSYEFVLEENRIACVDNDHNSPASVSGSNFHLNNSQASTSISQHNMQEGLSSNNLIDRDDNCFCSSNMDPQQQEEFVDNDSTSRQTPPPSGGVDDFDSENTEQNEQNEQVVCNDGYSSESDNENHSEEEWDSHEHQLQEIQTPDTIISNKSSKEIYKAVAKHWGITCKMSEQCRCMECQSNYFDCEFDENENQKTDGGLGAGTPMFISEVMHGSACTIL